MHFDFDGEVLENVSRKKTRGKENDGHGKWKFVAAVGEAAPSQSSSDAASSSAAAAPSPKPSASAKSSKSSSSEKKSSTSSSSSSSSSDSSSSAISAPPPKKPALPAQPTSPAPDVQRILRDNQQWRNAQFTYVHKRGDPFIIVGLEVSCKFKSHGLCRLRRHFKSNGGRDRVEQFLKYWAMTT